MKGCRVLDKKEIQALLNACPDQKTRTLLMVGLYLGTRISESIQLTFGDFRGQTVKIRSLKNSADRELVIPSALKTEIEMLRQEYVDKGKEVRGSTPLFLSQKGGHITRQQASSMIKKVREKAQIQDADVPGKVAAHSLRKNFVTKIHELCNNNLPQVAIYSGHKNLNSLQAYIETTQKTDLTEELSWT